jgi:aspartate aminotransferase/aminotransferase
MYKHLLTMAGGKAVPVDSYPDFRFHPDRVQRAITPKTKLLILNSPSNPTGVVMTPDEVAAAVALANKHNLLIISDEIYEPFLYAKAEGGRMKDETDRRSAKSDSSFTLHPSSFSSLPSAANSYDNTIILRGFSKSHAMTGWRLGYAAGPEPIISQMTKLQQYTYVCPPSPLQYAALAALDVPMGDAVAAYRRKRDIAFDRLSRSFDVSKPGGAFYIFPRAPSGATASDFVAKAIENNVLIIPGNVFSERDTHFRISYATTDDKLARGCDILCSLVSS